MEPPDRALPEVARRPSPAVHGQTVAMPRRVIAALGGACLLAVPHAVTHAAPTVAGCPVLPAGNVWNTPVASLPVDPASDAYMRAIGLDAGLHPDFSRQGRYGIPFQVVPAGTPRVRVRFEYASESDRGPYPIPRRPRIEGGSDRHALLIDARSCTLYELYALRRAGRGWAAGSGAVFRLREHPSRPRGWTSADAAGLPIFPGLARFAEVRAGAITHALRFTAPRTARRYIPPARHQAGTDGADLPPMGLRLRLKAAVDIASFPPQSRVVLTALRDYGMILADNGSPLFVGGAPDPRWDDDDLHTLGRLTGADFEVVDTRGLRDR